MISVQMPTTFILSLDLKESGLLNISWKAGLRKLYNISKLIQNEWFTDSKEEKLICQTFAIFQ
jgi:hypothetical protein